MHETCNTKKTRSFSLLITLLIFNGLPAYGSKVVHTHSSNPNNAAVGTTAEKGHQVVAPAKPKIVYQIRNKPVPNETEAQAEARRRAYHAHFYDPAKMRTYEILSKGILHVQGLTEKIVRAIHDYGHKLQILDISAPAGERSILVTVRRAGSSSRTGHRAIIPINSITYEDNGALTEANVMQELKEVELDFDKVMFAPFRLPDNFIELAKKPVTAIQLAKKSPDTTVR